MASATGSEALTGKRDFDKAKRLIAEAGYKGEKIVVLVRSIRRFRIRTPLSPPIYCASSASMSRLPPATGVI
jgi:hypothetical protein